MLWDVHQRFNLRIPLIGTFGNEISLQSRRFLD